jgi:LysR family transcriptional regulator, regulator for metE and metH
MLLETRHLKLVQEIAEQGGVTRASKRLFLTQSAVSHQLLELEKKLGTPLFHRAGKRMVPTAAGQRVLASACNLIEELEQLSDDLRRIAHGQEAVIRLSTECYTCYHWLPPLLSEYQRKFPNVDVQIVAEVTRAPVAALLDGKIDLAIVHTQTQDERLSETRLFRDEMVLVVPAKHRLAGKRYIEAKDLGDEHMIFYDAPLRDLTFYQQVLVPAAVTPRKITHIQLTEAIVEMVRAGIGVTPLARWAALPYLADGRLAAVRVTRQGVPRQWFGVTIRQEPMPRHLREFIQSIRLGPQFEESITASSAS